MVGVASNYTGWWCNNHLEKYESMGRITSHINDSDMSNKCSTVFAGVPRLQHDLTFPGDAFQLI